MGERKAVHLMFATGALIVAILTIKTFDWIWGFFSEQPPAELVVNSLAAVVAGTLAFVLYRNERVFSLSSEIAAELKKVSWPTGKETKMATLVVIITVFIASVILGVFDAFWSWLTDLLYR